MKIASTQDGAFSASDKATPALVSQIAARLSLATAVTFVILLAALHILRPELDPSWRFISEYAIGEFGGMMVLAFLSLSTSYLTLFLAIRSQIRTIGGYIGLACLLISAAGLFMAAIFPTDPITTSPEAMTTSGTLHNLGATLGIAMPFAAGFISWSLSRRPVWSSARRPLFLAAGLSVAASLLSIVALATLLPSDGHFGPDVAVGWPLRFEMFTYCIWLIVVAWQALRLQRQRA